ncbi:DUF2226 domain-containing protein [Methanothermobacter sp. K4]|uniref:DUF2226 domain-containing protein n=1 Tax=Methanothermobacter sp. K4 TaxID=2913262 RepID=UPI001EDAF11C|nr:DUF2226 domain-containing protein [Methanothermobacter sp. K4]MCG2829331.1 DUF4388 domain-containing protein [Methanothermobacter sp. K4]
MELPITKPSKISYGDEIDFSELLEKLASDEYNGFIRITHASDEGYILFRDGVHVAASYDRFMKEEALERIMEVADKTDTLIELFDLKRSQLDYLMDINRIYAIERIDERSVEHQVEEEETYFNPKEASYRQPIADEERLETSEIAVDTSPEMEDTEFTGDLEAEDLKSTETQSKPQVEVTREVTQEPETLETEEPPEIQATDESAGADIRKEEGMEDEASESMDVSDSKPLSRDELMKKYGLRDIGEEEVEKVLETYKGGAITDIDPERVELTLMNKIKMSILGIPRIKGAEVIVFLDNTYDLSGRIKIMVEHEGKGIFSRIIGDSKEEENLKFHIMDIVEMELRKTFRDFPEIVDNFEVSIEVR